eukprot:scaffold133297_cov71-Phaeocystis_antarctica.AAC.2
MHHVRAVSGASFASACQACVWRNGGLKPGPSCPCPPFARRNPFVSSPSTVSLPRRRRTP